MLVFYTFFKRVGNQSPELSRLAVMPLNIYDFKFKLSIVLRQTENKSDKL